MASYWQQLQQAVDIRMDPYEILGVSRTAKIEEVRRSYKQKVLETHPDKLPLTASEEERELAQDLFHQIQEAFRVLNEPRLRRAYDVHHRPLPEQTPPRAESRVSTYSRTTTAVVPTSTPTATPARASTPPQEHKLIPSSAERSRSRATAILECLNEAHERRTKERSEWAKKFEERRLDKPKAYTVSDEIQNIGQKRAALVEKMIQDLFALTPEWEARRIKALAYKASRANAKAH